MRPSRKQVPRIQAASADSDAAARGRGGAPATDGHTHMAPPSLGARARCSRRPRPARGSAQGGAWRERGGLRPPLPWPAGAGSLAALGLPELQVEGKHWDADAQAHAGGHAQTHLHGGRCQQAAGELRDGHGSDCKVLAAARSHPAPPAAQLCTSRAAAVRASSVHDCRRRRCSCIALAAGAHACRMCCCPLLAGPMAHWHRL